MKRVGYSCDVNGIARCEKLIKRHNALRGVAESHSYKACNLVYFGSKMSFPYANREKKKGEEHMQIAKKGPGFLGGAFGDFTARTNPRLIF